MDVTLDPRPTEKLGGQIAVVMVAIVHGLRTFKAKELGETTVLVIVV
jgi:hypothetical protein